MLQLENASSSFFGIFKRKTEKRLLVDIRTLELECKVAQPASEDQE